MKIIKNSKITEQEYTKEILCPVCDSVIEADASDFKIERTPADYQMEHDFYTATTRCPICNVTLRSVSDQDALKAIYAIRNSKVPPDMWQYINK